MCYVFRFRDINGVLRSANGTEYGLAAGVFTQDINKALHVSDRLLAGTVFVNTYNKTDVAAPFGGYKQSGFGKDLGQFLHLRSCPSFYINFSFQILVSVFLVFAFCKLVGYLVSSPFSALTLLFG